ncbi:MAG: prepilin-type N-terminal cleavage/methylation domain-containing protein [Acidobacteria bacterium]|nr:prepilin-type N-terminal cleavage/methylation domain-containing protein [Acidobacteriota bacterium]
MLTTPRPHTGQSGFTLVETMIALIILAGGLLALAGAFAQGMVMVSGTHYHQFAKEKASEAMESVFTARDAGKIPSWDWIQNKSSHPNGIFKDGAQPLCGAGDDGLLNTDDDEDDELETLPGRDGIPGTDDDEVLTIERFSREIEITQIHAGLRRIRVIIRYRLGNLTREYELVSHISPFA